MLQHCRSSSDGNSGLKRLTLEQWSASRELGHREQSDFQLTPDPSCGDLRRSWIILGDVRGLLQKDQAGHINEQKQQDLKKIPLSVH